MVDEEIKYLNEDVARLIKQVHALSQEVERLKATLLAQEDAATVEKFTPATFISDVLDVFPTMGRVYHVYVDHYADYTIEQFADEFDMDAQGILETVREHVLSRRQSLR